MSTGRQPDYASNYKLVRKYAQVMARHCNDARVIIEEQSRRMEELEAGGGRSATRFGWGSVCAWWGVRVVFVGAFGPARKRAPLVPSVACHLVSALARLNAPPCPSLALSSKDAPVGNSSNAAAGPSDGRAGKRKRRQRRRQRTAAVSAPHSTAQHWGNQPRGGDWYV